MKRSSTVWGVFLASLCVMTAVMVWTSRRMLDLERSEQRLAVQAESERLALWRMDSALLPLVSRESSRPPEGWDNVGQSAWQEAWPALIQFRFQAGADGQFQSLQGSSEFELFRQRVSAEEFAAAVQSALPDAAVVARVDELVAQSVNVLNNSNRDPATADVEAQQQQRNSREFQRRLNNTILQNDGNFLSQSALNVGPLPASRKAQVAASRDDTGRSASLIGPTTAFWFANQLVLARRINRGSEEIVQAGMLDWPALQTWLLSEVTDLLPSARMEPAPTPSSDDGHLLLAALPIRVVPGPAAEPNLSNMTPLRVSLATAWVWLAVSVCAIAVLLLGVVRLSERRAAFVSAVTHELRTPLTTFQLYADLLGTADDLSGEKCRRYVDTLRSEAERLRHLVENVLAWSRLERTAERDLVGLCDWSELWQRCEPTLRRRAEQAGMQLIAEPFASGLRLRANSTAVEQILFNLTDNACKYAAGADDLRIHVEATCVGNQVLIRVRDHGPGIPRPIRARLFQPFAKSATEAARSAPGVGLGLSLCRRLARSMRGDLFFEPSANIGTTFAVRLPAAS
jgi:signal transduction histidine kinase